MKWLILFVFFLQGCSFSSQSWKIRRANNAMADGDKKEALSEYKKAMEMDPSSTAGLQAAEKGAQLAYWSLKDYQEAISFNRSLVLNSPNSEERRSAERSVAQIYFENLQDYTQAIIEYEKLLKVESSDKMRIEDRLRVAKAQYQIGNFDQALEEIKALFKMPISEDTVYKVQILKSEIYVSQKKYAEAAQTLEDTIKKFPKKAKTQDLAFSLVVCYEDLKQFDKAIVMLEKMKTNYDHPEFIESRIKALKERIANRPKAER